MKNAHSTRPTIPPKKAAVKRNRATALLRHPLTAVLLGFFLSAVVGAYITRYYERLNSEQILIRSKQEDTKSISKTLAAYLASMQSLADALQTDEDKTIKLKINNYEALRDDWIKNNLLQDLILTDEFGSEFYQKYFYDIYFEPLQISISIIDDCLRKSVYPKINKEKLNNCEPPNIIGENWRYSSKNIQDRLNFSIGCFRDFETDIFEFARNSNERKDRTWAFEIRKGKYGCRLPAPGEPDTRGSDTKPKEEIDDENILDRIIRYWNNVTSYLLGPEEETFHRNDATLIVPRKS